MVRFTAHRERLGGRATIKPLFGKESPLMWILLYGSLLLSQIGTGTKQYAMKRCGAIAPGPYNSICINLIRAVFCLTVSFAIYIISDGSMTTLFGVLIASAAGIGTSLNLFTWIMSAQRISLTLLEGVCTVGSVILPLFFAPFLYEGETVSVIQALGSLLVVLSLFFFTNNKKEKAKKKSSLLGTALLLLVCALGGMIAVVTKKLYTFHIVSKELGSVTLFTLISFLVMLLFFALLFLFYRHAEHHREGNAATFPFRSVWFFVLLAAVALYVNELFATYASILPSAIYYPAAKALNILGCFTLDTVVFKEKITKRKLLGLALLLFAVVLINL